MASSTILLGPPAVAGNPPYGFSGSTNTGIPSPENPANLKTVSPDMERVITDTAALNLDGKPPMGRTENDAPTYLSSGNPMLDFFFHVVPDTPSDKLIERLALAWNRDALTTLKLVCNLRALRGTGKSDKEGFYTASIWLYQNHPKTLALNLRVMADFGYFKDFPEILYRILEGRQQVESKKRTWRQRNDRKSEDSGGEERETLEKAAEIRVPLDKEGARALRKQRELEKAKRALDKYNSDPNYRLLFDAVADLFADFLKSDLEFLGSDDLNKISLASKWCPSVDSSYDKCTLICEAIARRIFPRDRFKEYEGIEESHYAYRIRDRLRKQVLVPLRKAMELPEVFMSGNEWKSVKYERVPSVAMKNYKKLFEAHDEERFKEYLENVKAGKVKIAAGALLPHEIIAQLDGDDGTGSEVAELQWARMVDDLAKKGKLKNCISVCDVSGSMSGIPMEVCVALGLLVSELAEAPWKGKVITFSESPQLHYVQGDSLASKIEFIKTMDWGCNTDFQKVFDQILEAAKENKLTDVQMVKRLFVFSDMEFDEACVKSYWSDERETPIESNSWETDYEAIQRKFRENGFSKAPEIVFWNLRESTSTPVVANQEGVAMVSGFSKNLLTLFLEGNGIVNPEDVMLLAIGGEEYNKLVVYD